ncbi:prim-pol domain-containing protein [Aulographum hederae CBS 113979]|uniref:DNA primase n=1 Tax=Aulographum hederae CBS 113979 TaxID=1176131 RepID=A0A6G1GUI8_9PEZI|nr:prim-pol domain-containing protein [Aulographum hederae CBS 113979]
MPHAISPEPTTEPSDAVLPDAPASDAPSDPADMSGDDTAAPVLGAAESDKENRLEDMFDTDSDDDEFSSSAAKAEPSTTKPAQSGKFSDPGIMKAFYQRLFPYRQLFQWLNHSPVPTIDFKHREFAFTLSNDAYIRYESFASADLLRKQCIELLPSRFEIGPVYSTNPRERKTLRKKSAFRPLAKELVFDIDMTDYDEIRTCCTGAQICPKCWSFITMAVKVVDVALRDDFGFKHILWVYSGRRGAHAWVCDRRAREMDDQKRRSVAGYLELLKGGDGRGKKVNIKRPLHPHLQRSLKILRAHFQTDILAEQNPWEEDEKAAHLLDLLPDKALTAALRKKWDSAPHRASTSKWADIDALAATGVADKLDATQLKEAKQDILLEYTYPRLDAEVSKKLNHLLKSPFCVHPGTGRVCVPIDVAKVEDFDPFEVPTVTQLLDQIDEWDKEHVKAEEGEAENDEAGGAGKEQEKEKKLQDWEKTNLRPYVEYFRSFVNELLKDEKTAKREREEGGDPMEF